MLNLRVIANGKDPSTKGDGSTISFPCQSKKANTFSTKEFTKLLQCFMTKIYGTMEAMDEGMMPAVFRKKISLLTKHPDRVDDALESVLRNALNNGRSEARALFYCLIAFYFRTEGASMVLEHPSATAPALGTGKLSDYFSALRELRATASGYLPADGEDGQPGEGSTDALAGVHAVVRKACLYVIASKTL